MSLPKTTRDIIFYSLVKELQRKEKERKNNIIQSCCFVPVMNKKVTAKEVTAKEVTAKEVTAKEDVFTREIPNLFQEFDMEYKRVYSPKMPPPPEVFVPKEPLEPPPLKRLVEIGTQYAEIKTLHDLICLIEHHPEDNEIQYNIDMHSLHSIKPYLIELNNMIGLHSLKTNIVDQILYFSQQLHKNSENKVSGDFLHTVIYGPPGSGKTEVAIIMGKIFSQLGILKRNIFKKVTRSDLVAGYLGQTAIKTKEVIHDCVGGCLFIDEAYSLGNIEKKDSFAKECIDTLCEALSHYKDEIMVIVAGYEKELNECFFAYNKGLDSRFIWRFKTDDYNGTDLYHIFHKKVQDTGWTLDESGWESKGWFEKNMPYFTFYGRDMETLFTKTKLAHSRRIFCNTTIEKKKITMMDLERGFILFINNEEVKQRKNINVTKNLISTMYI